MRENLNNTILMAATLFIGLVSSHQAQAKPETTLPSTTNQIINAPICGQAPVGSLYMQAADNDRLDLARAFKSYLEDKGRDPRVVNAIYKASLKSGVDFELLLLKAIMESDLGQYNVATGSSARGLFQYIAPTWLVLMKRYGAELGYPHYADAIGFAGRSPVPQIKNKNKYLEAEILALRHDPEASAMMKALQIKEETDMLRSFKKSQVSATDHYISHMLGLPLSKELYDLRRNKSIIAVARLNKPEMREAAKLNKPFFYDGKRALTATEVYARFEQRVQREFRTIYTVGKTDKNVVCTAAKTTP